MLHLNNTIDRIHRCCCSKNLDVHTVSTIRLVILTIAIIIAQILIQCFVPSTALANNGTVLQAPVPNNTILQQAYIPVVQGIPYSPVKGRLTSGFGWRKDPYHGNKRFHSGIDIGASSGTPIYVPQDGVVTWSGWYKGYGKLVSVFHPPNLYTLYGHTSKTLVKRGQQVKAGTPIALVGSTGRSTGPHLHFEVRQNNGYVDPTMYLQYVQALQHNPVVANQIYHQINSKNNAQTFIKPDNSAPVPATSVGGPELSIKRTLSKNPKYKGRTVEVFRGNQVEVVEFR